MKSIITLILVSGVLVGCTQTVRTQYEFQEINVPGTLLSCPVIQKSEFPPVDATNKQVHTFIKRLWDNNQICGANMRAVSEYITRHNANVRELNKKK